MTLQEILLIMNTPALGAIFIWVIKVEKRLSVIETTCKIRNEKEPCNGD